MNLIFIHNWMLVWGWILWSVRNYKKYSFSMVFFIEFIEKRDLADDRMVPMIVFKLICLFNTEVCILLELLLYF